MTPRKSSAEDKRYILTEQGRLWSVYPIDCLCDVRLTGILFTCAECGTVYGSIRDAMKPRAQKWTYGRRG